MKAASFCYLHVCLDFYNLRVYGVLVKITDGLAKIMPDGLAKKSSFQESFTVCIYQYN